MTDVADTRGLTIFLPDELRARLETAAKRQVRPQAEVVRDALTKHLNDDEPPWPSLFGSATTKRQLANDRYDSSNMKD